MHMTYIIHMMRNTNPKLQQQIQQALGSRLQRADEDPRVVMKRRKEEGKKIEVQLLLLWQ